MKQRFHHFKFRRKGQAAPPLAGEAFYRPWQIARHCIFQHQIAVAADFKGLRRGGTGVRFQKLVHHLLPVYKQPEIRTLVVVANQITVETHGPASGGSIGHQPVGHLVVGNKFVRFPHADDQMMLKFRKILIIRLAEFWYSVVTFDLRPRQRGVLFSQHLPKLIIERGWLVIHSIEAHVHIATLPCNILPEIMRTILMKQLPVGFDRSR
ncbi:hypothetical protein SDC9_74693 [bioreactor metagenome]|uniref:Uncharacterized protein n=1 Tax=bioreactor metagenome TaxID=1076179 RepID=A0A644YPZ4_9ZZZZ